MGMFRNDKAIDALVKLGFVNPNGHLQAVEVECQSNIRLFAKKAWFGFGGYVLTDDPSGHLVRDTRWLVTPWGAEYPEVESGKSFVQIKKVQGQELHDPVVQGIDKYTGLQTEVIKFALVSCHSYVDTNGVEFIFYAARSIISCKVGSAKDVADMPKVVALMGVKRAKDKDGEKKSDSGKRNDCRGGDCRRDGRRDSERREDRRDYRRDDRRDDRRYRDDYRDEWRGGRGRR
jgi:hypothetical protein